jgi:hypothetical protein
MLTAATSAPRAATCALRHGPGGRPVPLDRQDSFDVDAAAIAPPLEEAAHDARISA